MSDYCYTTISLDDAFDCYEFTKREATENPLYCYDIATNRFVKINNKVRDSSIVFINSYKLCLELIDEYLNQPSMKEYKSSFYSTSKNAKNKIVSFLWFFEHIDGCYDFEKFERLKVEKKLKKWCKINGLEYLEPEVYRAE